MAQDWKPKRKFVDPTKLSRKVFDAHVDSVEVKRKRDRDDHRADMKAMIEGLDNLETILKQTLQQQADILEYIRGEEPVEDGSEELE